jgi:hypothetical protein
MVQSCATMVTTLTTTMKGSGYAAARCCAAGTEDVSAGFFCPHLSPVPRAVARGPLDARSPDPHPDRPDCASSRYGRCLFLSSGMFTATRVGMGAGPQVAARSAERCRAARTWMAGRRGDGGRPPGPPRLRHGPPSRWRARDPPLYRVSLGAEGGGGVGTGHAPMFGPPLGPPGLGRLVAAPRMGSGAGDAPQHASASGPAAAGTPPTWVAPAPMDLGGGDRLRHARDRTVLSQTPPPAPVGQPS